MPSQTMLCSPRAPFAFQLLRFTRFACALVFMAALPFAKGTTWTWTGNGGDPNWTTLLNWNLGSAPVSLSTTDLIFAGTNNTGTSQAPLLQLVPAFQLNSLSFAAGSGTYYLGGNSFAFTGTTNSITQNSSSAQFIANGLAATANATTALSLGGNGTGVVTISGAIAAGNGNRDYSVVKSGTGTFSLSGTNTYAGGTTINGGTLIANSSASLGAVTGGLSLNAGTLEIATGFTSARAITLGNAASTFQIDPSQTFTLSSAMAGAGALNKTGAGTMVLGGANTFSGGTIISLGILQIAASERILNGTSLTVSGGTFDLQSFNETVGVVSLINGSIVGSGTLTGSDYQFENGVVGAGLGGTAGLTKSTSGTVTLNGASSYSGGTTINGGTLSINAAANLGAAGGGLTVNAGTLEIATGFSTGRAMVLGNAASTVQVDTGQTYTVTSAISGAGALNKTGAGTMILNGANIFSGGTVVAAGTLQIGSSERLQDTSSLSVSGGSFDLGTFTETTGSVTLLSGSIVGTGAGKLTGTSYGLESGVVSAILAGPGAVNKSTTGLVTLSGNNSYSGSTTIAAGILRVNANNGLGTTAGGTTVSAGASLSLNNVNYATAEPLFLNGSGASNGGALTNIGTSTFAGPVTIATNATINAGGGTLNFTGGLAKNGTTLTFTGGGTVNITTTGISGSAANSDLVIDGTTVVLSAASTYNGPTTIQNSGTLQLGNSNVLPTSPVTAMTLDATRIFNLA